MYEKFVLRENDKGKIRGYKWVLQDPDKVVCIVHGIGEYGGRYDRVASRFAEAGFATVSMDLRGHGESMNEKGHCAPRKDVLEDINELLLYAKREYPEKEIVLYGHSMGGNLVLDYRFRGELNDIPAAFLISAPWIKLVKPVKGLMFKFAKTMSRVAPSMTISSAVDEEYLGHPDSVKPYKTNPMVHNSISFLCAVDGMETGEAMELGSNEDNGRTTDTPTMIMHGTADKICDIEGTRKVYERLKARGDKVDFIEWQGFYHEIHNGNAVNRGDEVISRMIDFIRDYK